MSPCRRFIGLTFVAAAVAAAGGLAASATSQPATAEKAAASALEQDVVALLADLNPTSDLASLQKTLSPKLLAAVAKQFIQLNAGAEPTVIESIDGRFVVVVIGDAADGVNGKDVRATSDAELLLVVGGNAGVRSAGGEGFGGTGHAEAKKGIGIGLGGTGGRGNGDGVGSGGGGAAGATGAIGSIALGGAAGEPGHQGGRGTSGTGIDPVGLAAIINAAKAWDVKR